MRIVVSASCINIFITICHLKFLTYQDVVNCHWVMRFSGRKWFCYQLSDRLLASRILLTFYLKYPDPLQYYFHWNPQAGDLFVRRNTSWNIFPGSLLCPPRQSGWMDWLEDDGINSPKISSYKDTSMGSWIPLCATSQRTSSGSEYGE